MYTSLDASQSVPGTLYDNTMIFQDLLDAFLCNVNTVIFFPSGEFLYPTTSLSSSQPIVLSSASPCTMKER